MKKSDVQSATYANHAPGPVTPLQQFKANKGHGIKSQPHLSSLAHRFTVSLHYILYGNIRVNFLGMGLIGYILH